MTSEIRRAARAIVRDRVLQATGFKCCYCGKSLLDDVDTFATLSRDHLVPRSHGGSDHRSNRVASCAACDRLKAGVLVTSVSTARVVITHRRSYRQAVLERVRQLLDGRPHNEHDG